LENINTERLLLRKFEIGDIDNMLKNWIADPSVQNEYGEPVFETRDAVKNLLDKWDAQQFRWAIILKNNMENIGQVGFCKHYSEEKIAEIEYCIGKKFWGNGYAAEAVNVIIDFIFSNSDIKKLEAFYRKENPNSGKVLEKTGMSVVPNVKRFEIEGKTPDGKICYAITEEQYINIFHKKCNHKSKNYIA
jgi:ribosomal-protein-alanine N-acetyltransferase